MAIDERFATTTTSAAGRADARNRKLIAFWLFAVCVLLFGMIVLGGATRLTGSGLSIMEWAPVSGVLPPLTETEWRRLYALYEQIPQYRLLHAGMGLAGFKQIFWLEWVHRLWGRLIGIAFFLPLIAFWISGRLPRALRPRLLLFFVLGGLQGAVGWFMVASGFAPESTAVSPYRLVVHLVLALALYAAILWTALSLLRPEPQPVEGAALLRRMVAALAALAALTILAGGFVAGLHAGLDYNSFPLMDGRLVPEAYGALTPWFRNLTESIAAVQFDHRLLASLTLLAAACAAVDAWRARLPAPARRAVLVLAFLIAAQYALGVATLLAVVPVSLAIAHQAMAVLVLTAALTALHTLRGARFAAAVGAPLFARTRA